MTDYVRSLILVTILLASAALGWFGNGWRLDAIHHGELATKQAEIDKLANSLIEQNAAIESLAAAGAAADARRKLAEQYASNIVKRIDARAGAVAASEAADCDGVMREAWGNWK